MTTSVPPALEFSRTAFAYPGGAIAVEADLRIDEGSWAGLVGPSGSGKTTLLRAAIGQLRPVRGEVRLSGRPVGRRLPRRVGYVPQLETIDWNFPVTVAEVVLMGLAGESGPWPWPRRSDQRALDATLDRLGITQLRSRHLRSLSGGQQQRVFLARAMIRRPDLLLLDEPTSGLDVRTRQEILALLEELNRSGITIVLTTHDLNGVAGLLPEVVCLNRRVVAQGRPDAVFTPDILRQTFGSEILVFHHDGILVTADAPPHGPEHTHHLHLHHGPDHPDVHHGVESQETAG
ncbi:MAG: ABC transporter ATP-binding protein [Actinomycetota bacterium]|nr:ABC transporter ATP-binding protein [Actinomycetota bacterium]